MLLTKEEINNLKVIRYRYYDDIMDMPVITSQVMYAWYPDLRKRLPTLYENIVRFESVSFRILFFWKGRLHSTAKRKNYKARQYWSIIRAMEVLGDNLDHQMFEYAQAAGTGVLSTECGYNALMYRPFRSM